MNEPLDFWPALSATPLLQRAAVAGALVGLACAALSPFVVLRRMAFIGEGMAHSAFGGLGLGLFLLTGSRSDDAGVQAVVLGFCLVLALAVGRASRRAGVGAGRIAEDSAIGVAFSVAMALGALFITLRQRRDPQYAPSWDGYLFGSLMAIGEGQVWLTFALAGAVALILILFQKEWAFYAYDENQAEVSGLPVAFLHYLFLLMIVLTVVVSSRVVGIVLSSASLILPGLFGLTLCRRLPWAMAAAALSGVLSYELGLYFSYVWNVPPGSAVILIQFAAFLAALATRRWRTA